MENELQVIEPQPLLVLDDVMKVVVKENDFVTIKGNIEMKRDLALKLFSMARLDCDAEASYETIEGETVAMVKAKVWRGDRHGTGLGACSLKEIAEKDANNARLFHDALAIAETRAYKRALEMAVGLPFINDIIMRLFPETMRKWGKNGVVEKERDHWAGKIHEVVTDKDYPEVLRNETLEWLQKKPTITQLKDGYDRALAILDKQQKAKAALDEPDSLDKAIGDAGMQVPEAKA